MVINETVLERQIREQYKGGGYTVITDPEGWTVIMCPAWIVKIKNDHIPRKVISLMALHLGFLPEPETAYRIMKGSGEPSVQDMIYESATENVRWLDEGVEEVEAGKTVAVPVKKTQLTLAGYSLWQKTGNGGMVMIAPDVEGLFRSFDGINRINRGFWRRGLLSECFVNQADPSLHEKELNHLARITWAG